MLDLSLLKDLLIVASAAGIIVSAVVQRIKETLKTKKYLLLLSLVTSLIVGILFTLTFTSYNLIESLWVSLFAFVGADMLYKTFEDKLFTSFSSLQQEDIAAETNEEQSSLTRIGR